MSLLSRALQRAEGGVSPDPAPAAPAARGPATFVMAAVLAAGAAVGVAVALLLAPGLLPKSAPGGATAETSASAADAGAPPPAAADPAARVAQATEAEREGRAEVALRLYLSALAAAPGTVAAREGAMRLTDAQPPQTSLPVLEEIARHLPEDAGVFARLGYAQARLGRLEPAVRSLEWATSRDPGNAVYLFNLAVLYDRLGRGSDAARYYQLALARGAEAGIPLPQGDIRARLTALATAN